MGVDFTACGGHHLEPGSGFDPRMIADHPDFRLAVEWTRQYFREFNPGRRDDEPRWELRFGIRTLHLPGTFWISFGRHLFELNHNARWWTFLTDSEGRAALRLATRAVADVLGSPEVYYVPDSCFAPSAALDLVWDGGTVTELRSKLMDDCGPPTLDLSKIYPEHDLAAITDLGYFGEASAGCSSSTILQDIESERRWDDLFARPESVDVLSRMADEALAEARTGRAKKLDVDEL